MTKLVIELMTQNHTQRTSRRYLSKTWQPLSRRVCDARISRTACLQVALLFGLASNPVGVVALPTPDQAATAQRLIYTCTDHEGRRTFTDRGCNKNEHTQTHPSQLSSFVEFSPLTQAERLTLDELATATERAISQRKRAQRKAQTAAKQQLLEQAKRCEQANAALEALSAQRRSGYSAREHASLESREARLQRQKRDNC